MKIIDLLNMISKGEEVPNKIKYANEIYKYNYEIKDWEYEDKCGWLMDISRNSGNEFLNDEVEVLEENLEEITIDENGYLHTELGSFKGRKMDLSMANKINTLIRNQKYILGALNDNNKNNR